MDIATLIGFLGAMGMIAGAMISAGGIGPFIDVPSVLIVFGGAFFAVMYTAPMGTFLSSFGAMAKAFMPKAPKPEALIETMVELSNKARKDGMMALEGAEVPDKFFGKGLQMLVDGADEHKMAKQMNQEIKAMKARHAAAQGVLKAWVDIAPAMGMIGTLIGLVQMLQALDDPSAIGPAMAVALLTTLYGAIIAFMVAGPIADKLEGRTKDEQTNMRIIMDGVDGILKGENPRLIMDKLESYLAPKARTPKDED